MSGCEDITDVGTKSRPINSSSMLPPCRICSEKASGFHYGANTCEACKVFFRRSLRKKVEFKCTFNDDCNTHSVNRNVCPACRYKKCTRVGMSISAIKTGRYTHQKKTENIREVKQLEQALQSPPQPGPSHDTVAPSDELPMEVAAENKYEKVLQDIIASFDKHELYAGNFFANLKETEDNYMAERRLYEDMFGSMRPVPADEYIRIYQLTGIDIDGRRQLFEHMIPHLESSTRRLIAFVKSLPGFHSLPMEDQMMLIKISRHEMFTILAHKIFNHERGLMTFFWGETMDIERLSKLHSIELIRALFSVSSSIQKLELSRTETVILSCIILFFTDPHRCELKRPEKVEESKQLMIEAFSYILKKKHPDKPDRLAQCLRIFPEVRSLARLFCKEEENFTVTWNDGVKFPPLLYELWSA